jgi:predicted dehydrogenase
VLRSDDVAIEVTDADGTTRPVTVGGADEYRLEVEDFSRCVLEGRQPEVVSHEDTLWNMRTIDALYASAREGRAVRL